MVNPSEVIGAEPGRRIRAGLRSRVAFRADSGAVPRAAVEREFESFCRFSYADLGVVIF